jgi:hypothetical protein
MVWERDAKRYANLFMSDYWGVYIAIINLLLSELLGYMFVAFIRPKNKKLTNFEESNKVYKKLYYK